MKKYFELKENDGFATHLECEVYYSKGGMNYFTYREEARGYYLMVTPVKIERNNGYKSISFCAFTGTKKLLKSVSRKSDKAQAEAEKIAENVFNELVEYVLNKHGIELAVSPVGVTSGTVESVA